ncbi:hypothetical protein GE061_002639 [Apolygus lucorum]|uniref:Cytochrome c oxidase subunit 7C, mitochondrial n=1 Tax=Apolygus lucorum TaxID=248454 RepID=A0A6A4JA40_APOLU|nr:hypothetical protein GE061_002639 [Apolygus lucorum]
MITSRLVGAARQFSTTAIKRGGHGGSPGENLPFKLGSPFSMTVKFILFFSIPLAAPFLIVRHQMLKKSQHQLSSCSGSKAVECGLLSAIRASAS